jgi:hypothetical protein
MGPVRCCRFFPNRSTRQTTKSRAGLSSQKRTNCGYAGQVADGRFSPIGKVDPWQLVDPWQRVDPW